MFAPLLTEFDPADSAEGGVDPLGLYAIADSLATRLIPGVRERMNRIRFLTAIAASSIICSEFEENLSTSEQSIEPYLVFEMYLVEGLMRTCQGQQIRNLPGSLKAERAIGAGVPLSSANYLVLPYVYGFHGVYRLLVKTLDVVNAGRLGEKGYELINVWTEEQGLAGFYGAVNGPGWNIRQQLQDAVRDGVDVTGTTRSAGWTGWQFFKNNLHPDHIGAKEAELLRRFLMDQQGGHCGDVMRFLVKPEGKTIWEKDNSEREFHKGLRNYASSSLLELLDAIFVYENFARSLLDAFQDCLYLMTSRIGKVLPTELAKTKGVMSACKKIPEMFSELSSRLGSLGETIRFETIFSGLAERLSPLDWVQVLMQHHQKIQRQKPPNGKNPWFERFDDGSVVIRPMYRRNSEGSGGDEYVHGYRTFSLFSFCKDLHLIRNE